MASKKYKLILAFLGLISIASFGQRNDANYNWVLDSSKVSTKNMAQHNEFMNNTYPYPSKPRSMWELGFAGGHGLIVGDRPAFTKQSDQSMYNGGVAGGITVRKALGHVFSLRGGYFGSIIHVPGYFGRGGNLQQIYVKNHTHMLSLELLTSLNTIGFYRGDPKTNLYVLGGYSAVATHLIDGNFGEGKSHLIATQPSNPVNSQRDLALTFGSREKQAVVPFGERQEWGVWHGVSAGGGIAFRLSDKVNLALEERVTISLFGFDGMDGFAGGDGGDMLAYSTARLNLNIGSSATKVPPLWWVNPLNYAYNEINTPKHMKIPPPVLPDADGDGVTDQFDMEPNTPAGCPVDSHGVSRDTDGDGVPDCKDKEPLTQRNCFPVDADGVGKCPCPADSCFPAATAATACALTTLPSVQFRSGSVSVNSTATAILNNVGQQLMANPNCNVKVVGYGASDKRSQQLSWDHVNAVIKYLVEKQGISESRFLFTYGQQGDPNTVDLIPTVETGPNTVPAPFPNLQKTR